MSSDYGALSLLPPLFAIGLAIWTKQVYLALMTGIWLGWTIVDGFHPATGLYHSIEALADLFQDGDHSSRSRIPPSSRRWPPVPTTSTTCGRSFRTR